VDARGVYFEGVGAKELCLRDYMKDRRPDKVQVVIMSNLKEQSKERLIREYKRLI